MRTLNSRATSIKLLALGLLCCGLVWTLARPARAGVAAETNDVLTFEYQQVGASEEEAVRLACIRAVRATVGRLLFSNYSLQARDLLEPYVQKQWNRFVASSYVLERRFERDGFGCRIRVQTFPEKLSRDLIEKRFLYQPRIEPYHYIFFAQSLDNQWSDIDLGRRAVIENLLQSGYKVYETGVQVPPNTADVMADASLFNAAREASQRIGAELFVAGRAHTQLIETKDILYATISTYETRVELQMIRADDGTRVGASVATQRASDSDPALARDESIRSATQNAVELLIGRTQGIYRSSVLDPSAFTVMVSDLTPEEVPGIQGHLEHSLGYSTKARLRHYYGGVAIFSITTERAYAALERAIQDFRGFDLRITDHQGKRVAVEAHH